MCMCVYGSNNAVGPNDSRPRDDIREKSNVPWKIIVEIDTLGSCSYYQRSSDILDEI